MTEEAFRDDRLFAIDLVRHIVEDRKHLQLGLQRKKLDRKLRLYAAAECRRTWPLLEHPESREAVSGAESYADGVISTTELTRLRQKALPFVRDSVTTPAEYAAAALARKAPVIHWTVGLVRNALLDALPPMNHTGEEVNLHSLKFVRDVFGNHLRAVHFDSRCRTADSIGLARGIYDDRAFDRLPVLADALMDAGCDDERILEHCRGPGPHVRGCWVVDLVLGKE